jgi:hypothetical protein
MEAVLESEELRAEGFALFPLKLRPGARELERSLIGLGAAVAEERAIHPCRFREPQSEGRLSFVVVEVRNVNQLATLLDNGLLNRRMRIAQRIDADAAEQIEIAHAVFVDQMHAFATLKEQRIAVVGDEQQLRLSCFQFVQFHRVLLS